MSEANLGLDAGVLEAFQGVADAVTGHYHPGSVLRLADFPEQKRKQIVTPQLLFEHRGMWFGIGVQRLNGAYLAEAVGQLPLRDPAVAPSLDEQEREMRHILSERLGERIALTMLPNNYPPSPNHRRMYASLDAVVPTDGRSPEGIAVQLPLLTDRLITAFGDAKYLR